MGAANVLAAYRLYAGQLPPTSLLALVYMAAVSLDRDAEPSWWEGHEMLAIRCLGRTPPADSPDLSRAQQQEREAVLRAVERAITPLLRAGAITTTRHASGHAGHVTTVRYRLWITRPAPDDMRRERHGSTRRYASGARGSTRRYVVPAPDDMRRTEEDEEDLEQERDNADTAPDLADLEGAGARPDQDQIDVRAADRRRQLQERLAEHRSPATDRNARANGAARP